MSPEPSSGRLVHPCRVQLGSADEKSHLLVLTLLCVVVMLLIGGETLYYVEGKFVEVSGESLALAAVDIADKLDNLMTERYGDIQMLAHSQTFKEQNVAIMNEYLQWMIESYPQYQWLGVVDAAGRIIASTDPASVGGDRSEYAWFQSVRDHGGVHVRQPQVGPDTGGVMAVAFTAPIYSATGGFIGAVTSRVSVPALEDTITQTVVALQAQWGTTARIEYQFMTRDGEMIADSHLREESRVNLKQLGLKSAMMVESFPPGYVEEQHVRRAGMVVTGHAMTKGVDGRDTLRWGILVRVDRTDIVGPIRVTIAKIGLAGVVMLAPLYGIVLWSVRRMRSALDAAREERQLAHDAEQSFQQLVAAAPDALVMTDSDSRIVLSNRQAEALFGFSQSELTGQLIEVLVPERLRAGHRDHYASFVAAPAVRPMGARLNQAACRRDGSEFPAEISLNHMETSKGRFVIAAIRDGTQQQCAKQELMAAKEAAESSARIKADFLATMSHEIRTPMNGVIGVTDLLLETDLTAEQRDYAETIRSSGEHLLGLLNEILDFSKIESGKIDLESIPFDLRTLVEDVGMLLAARADAKGLDLELLVKAGLPTAVQGDPGRLRQVLVNLVGNAIKFTERGEVVVVVERDEAAAAGPEGSTGIRFEVRDTGIGLTPAQCAKLFQPFSQGDSTTTRKYGGTGLGLAISKQLVEAMGGRIGVESMQHQGACFWFTLRLPRQKGPKEFVVPPHTALAGGRILIVNHHDANGTMLEQALHSQGMRIEGVAEGVTALAWLRAAAQAGAPFDAAILDPPLPDMDVWTLAERIKADPAIQAVRLLLVTSHSQRGDRRLAKASGFDAYLVKPIRQVQLLDCLSRALGGPAAVAEPQLVKPLLITRHTVAEVHGRRRGTVLVVDDNLVNQKVMAKLLKRAGYRVEVVANGLEAVEATARTPYTLVFMDCQMPEMDGFAATQAIRRREETDQEPAAFHGADDSGIASRAVRHVPIIAMTANAFPEDSKRCLAAGMDDYLAKPVHMKELATLLARWERTGNRLPEEPSSAPTEKSDPGTISVDPLVLAELRGLDETGGLLATLMAHYLEETPQRVTLMQAALTRGDTVTLTEIAHALQGASGNLGAIRMEALCSELQALGRAEDLARARDLLARLQEEWPRVRQVLFQLPAGFTERSTAV